MKENGAVLMACANIIPKITTIISFKYLINLVAWVDCLNALSVVMLTG